MNVIVDGIAMLGSMSVEAEGNGVSIGGGGMVIDGDFGGGNMGDLTTGMDEGGGAPFQPMTSMPFIIGITAVSLAASIGLGFLFSHLKIKKGIDVYED